MEKKLASMDVTDSITEIHQLTKKKNTSKIEKQINPDDATLIDQIIFILFSFFHGQISRINHLREV